MAMVVLLHHYEIFLEIFLKSGEKMCRSPPRLSDFFRAGAKFYGSRSSSGTFWQFCPPPPLSKPWRRPWSTIRALGFRRGALKFLADLPPPPQKKKWLHLKKELFFRRNIVRVGWGRGYCHLRRHNNSKISIFKA